MRRRSSFGSSRDGGRNMTVLDVSLLVAIVVSGLIGLWRGLVREVLSLVVWVAAAVLALALAPRVADLLAPHLAHEQARFATSIALVFLGTVVAGGIATWLIVKLVDTSGLTALDRTLGLAFGVARGAVLCIVAMIMLRPFAGDAPWWQSSVVIANLEPFESLVLELFDETAALVRGFTRQL
jgi:membrane protein required for colicin V production